jgi:hypothetical protein
MKQQEIEAQKKKTVSQVRKIVSLYNDDLMNATSFWEAVEKIKKNEKTI